MTGIIAIACIVSLVWGIVLFHRGSLLLGSFAFLVVGYCVGRDVVRFDVGSLPITLERLVLAALMAMCVFQLLTGKIQWARLTWVENVAIAFGLVLVASTFLHDWKIRAYEPIYRLVACYLMPLVLYFVVRNARLTERSWQGTYLLLALFGVYLAITACAEAGQQWWLVYPQYISDPKLGIHFGRSRGPALQSQSLGLYLGLTGVCMWTYLSRLGPIARLVRFPLAGLFLVGLYFTSTRCSWMGAALAIFIITTMWLPRAWRPVLFAGSLLAVCSLYFAKDSLIELSRGDQSRAAASDSVDHRTVYLHVSWLMFQDRPIFGCGAGQFVPEVVGYLAGHEISSPLSKIRGIPHHNTFLSLLVETGIIGCGLYLALVWGWARQGYLLWTTAKADWMRWQGLVMLATLGVYLPDALFFDPGSYAHQDHYFVFLLAGITSGVYAAMQPRTAVVPVFPMEPVVPSGTRESLGLAR